MTDFNLSTGNSQPINRTGADNIQLTGEDVQGTLVGIDYSGADPQLVPADADSATAIHAIGAFFQEEVFDPSTLPTGQHFHDLEEQLINEYKTLVGDRGTFVFMGVELVNDDDDTDFDPGEPVYLDVGGGLTQNKPTGSGEIVQRVGVALTKTRGGDGSDRVLLDVDFDYEVLA